MKKKIVWNSKQRQKQLYQDIVWFLKYLGFRVIHTKKIEGTAYYNFKNRYVTIRSKYKNKLFGAYTLAHELGHIIDVIYGKFLPEIIEFIDRPMPIALIRKIEWSATQFAKIFLKQGGFNISYWKDFDKRHFDYHKNFMPWWIKWYNFTRLGFEYPNIQPHLKHKPSVKSIK